MATNVGNQLVSLIYFANATSGNVNQRFLDIRPRGIYNGGRLTIVDNTHVTIATLVCEIGDADHQVRIQTQSAVNVVVGTATPYVVLRWAYVEVQSNAYMDFVAVATPSTNDLVVGKCNFDGGGSLLGFDYGDSDYPRATPDEHQCFLKVVPTASTELRALVKAGYVQDSSGASFVSEQKTDLLTAPTANSKIYLVYVDAATGTVAIDATGVEAASPAAPAYAGRLVIAEITLASGATNVTASNIKDVRPFLTSGPSDPDDTYIQKNASGQLTVVNNSITFEKMSKYYQGASLPGWYTQYHTGSNTLPSQFNYGDPSSRMVSLGQIIFYAGIPFSLLFTMQVNNASGAAKAVTQKLRYQDNDTYFYLNDSVTPFKTVIGAGYKSDDITWNLASGLNSLYIVHNNYGGPGSLGLFGDIINDTDVYFVGNV